MTASRRSTISSAWPRRSRGAEPRTAAQRIPAAFAAVTPSGVSSKTSTASGVDLGAEPVERDEVALRIGLRPRHVLGGDGERDVACEAGSRDDPVEHLAPRRRDDADRYDLSRGGDSLSRGGWNRGAVAGGGEKTGDTFADELWIARAEPRRHPLLVRQARELPEVLLAGDRATALGVELPVDLEPDRLVVREGAVEVEEDCPCRAHDAAASAARQRRSTSPAPSVAAVPRLLPRPTASAPASSHGARRPAGSRR